MPIEAQRAFFRLAATVLKCKLEAPTDRYPIDCMVGEMDYSSEMAHVLKDARAEIELWKWY